jgi:hypothetical protein
MVEEEKIARDNELNRIADKACSDAKQICDTRQTQVSTDLRPMLKKIAQSTAQQRIGWVPQQEQRQREYPQRQQRGQEISWSERFPERLSPPSRPPVDTNISNERVFELLDAVRTPTAEYQEVRQQRARRGFSLRNMYRSR